MKVNATIEIELPDDIAKEYEPVAFRVPQHGEYVLSSAPHVFQHTDIRPIDNARIILRRRFQWPSWLKCRYLTWSENNVILLFDAKPKFDGICWTAPGGALAIDQSRIDLPFPGGDWTTRIEENPNWKGDA